MKRVGTIWGAAWTLVLGLCLLAAPHAARAQTLGDNDSELSENWNIRIGLFIPNSQAARNKSGEVGFSGIVERTVYSNRDYDLNIGVGYNGMDDVYSVPITVMGIGHHHNLRYGLGAGYSFGKRIDGRGTSGAVIGLLVGYQLTRGKNALSADLRYNFISGSNDELDGYSLTIGYRF